MKSSRDTIGDGQRGPVINIAVWICLIISGITIIAKILTRPARRQDGTRRLPLGSDDLVLTLALIFAAGQSLAVSRQITAGLGTHEDTAEVYRGADYEKAGYASQLLYVCTLSLAKIATILFSLKLDATRQLPQLTYTIMAALGLWFITSILIVAFQCSPSPVWKIYTGKCISQFGFWAYVEVGNVSIDVFLAIFLCFLVRDILKVRTKYVLWIVFAARSLVIPAVALRLLYLYQREYDHIGDDETRVVIATAVAMNTSVMITCIPFLKPLMEQLQPGWATSNIRHGVGYNIAYGKKNRSGLTYSDRFPTGSVVASKRTNSKQSHPVEMGATLDSIELHYLEE